MTEHDRRTFMGSLAALFAGFTAAGASELELIQATNQFLEDPEGEEETSSSSEVSSCSCIGGCPPGIESHIASQRKHCPYFSKGKALQ